jgi:hypothetical protein
VRRLIERHDIDEIVIAKRLEGAQLHALLQAASAANVRVWQWNIALTPATLSDPMVTV